MVREMLIQFYQSTRVQATSYHLLSGMASAREQFQQVCLSIGLSVCLSSSVLRERREAMYSVLMFVCLSV